MSNQIYNWKRFWCPREGKINLSDGGYLSDPESEWGHIYNPDVVPFESIAKNPCLVLLGEPGIGKTSTMQAEQKAIEKKIEKEGCQTLWLDLRSYGSEDRLVHDLFENETFVFWANGNHILHVFLDSLDEGLLLINNMAVLLIDEFKKRKYPIERLYLRIACRTADWPSILENGLKELWGNDVVKVYELAPLRRMDVVEAAKVNNLDPEAFLYEIDRKEVVPLTIKPITLNFLLNTYRKKGSFPSTKSELYLEGCRRLCEETSESRRDAGLTGAFTAEQRLAVAARIAAIIIFANKYAVWTGIDWGDIPDEDVTVHKLCGGKENVNGNEFEVSEAAVKEAIATGLFSSRGLYRMGWAHQTYAEFLAARYLLQHQMTTAQIMSLIVHPGDPDGKLVPQLYEAAAWLAGMLPDVFRAIMRADPEVLLRSDVATAEVKDRAALVENLLRLYDEEKLVDRDTDIRKQYKKLAHPRLAKQLQPYICDSTKGIVVRRVAIDIAEACELQKLQEELTDIALDPSQPIPIRVNASYALYRIADDETKAKLKPLATGEAGDDPDDELKGCGLRAVWPAYMTARELFFILTYPKRENLFGAYQLFLRYELVPHIQPPDLPKALKWVEEQGPRGHIPYSIRELMDAIMLKAWQHLESPGVLKAFAKAALERLKHHEGIVGDRLNNEDEKRRQVLKTMLPMLSDPERDSFWLACSSTPLLLSKDIPWMIERLKTSRSEKSKRAWAQLINRLFDWRKLEYFDAIFSASKSSPILAETLAWILEPVDLISPKAQKMKYDYLMSQKLQKWQQDRPPLKPPPSERIAILLDECENNNLAAWWHLNREMTLESNSTSYGDELESNLKLLPGWKISDIETRARIVKAAKRYVLDQDPETHKWLGTDIFYRPAIAGYKALRLLVQDAPSFISTIPVDVWKRWAPIILGYPTSSGVGGEEPHQELARIAYQHAPHEIIKSLILMIAKECSEVGHIFITRKVESCWDNKMANALLKKAKDKKLKPKCMGSLLSSLLTHKVDEAKKFAESLVPIPPPSGEDQRSRAIVAAHMLINYADDAGWSVVWPAIQQDVEFGKSVLSLVAHAPDEPTMSIMKLLNEDQLADLYIWLVHQYPYAEDPKDEGANFVGPRESVAMWRDNILWHLKARGTHKACEAIRRIIREFPELNLLKWTLLEAQNIALRHTWLPPRPVDILMIASNQQRRLVQSGDQLLDVLVESLNRLEQNLHGKRPEVPYLWNKIEKDIYKPKDENAFSDYIAMHLDKELKQRGIIINREVQIRQVRHTDIHVDAVVKDSSGKVYDSVTTIIEVKGCWHRKLFDAMEKQLVNKYLKNGRCHHALYLVGWFNCDKWDKKDYRRRRSPSLSINEAQKKFDAQAAKLSQQNTRIKALVINMALC